MLQFTLISIVNGAGGDNDKNRSSQPVVRDRISRLWQPMSSVAGTGTLQSRVTVVTGASRGAGRGIAATLGAEGATVYVTGRSSRGQPTTENLPGTIEETAEIVTARGGIGIPVRCDHTVD